MHLHYKSTRINYAVTGNGPVLVLLHGFLENSSMWNVFVPVVSKKFRVLTIDLPGHGVSGVIGKVHSMSQMADVVLQVLETENIPNATFIGHSMGGYVLLALAKTRPHVINKLVLLNSTPFPDSEARLANRKQALKLLQTVPDKFISMAITNLFAPQNRSQLQAKIAKLKKEALAMDPQGITAAIRGMMQRKDLSHILKDLHSNGVLIASKEDPIIDIVLIKEVAAGNGNIFRSLPGGHMSTYEHPKMSLKTIVEVCY